MNINIKRLLIVACLAISPTVWADKPETPTKLAGAKVIGADEGKALAAAKTAAFIDTRNPLNFGKGHVPGAVTAAYKEKSEPTENFDASLDSFTMDKLPTDKNAKVVFYSDGPSGWKSYKAAVMAVKAGYKNVMYMRGGFTEWESKGLPVER
ncbi:MAG: rhodanese-like domain-containing protein [Burkholderiaceae bacterium]|nr:rhodanese-like domain-containing protein [Burkholderiaceae bacterium]